jgi:hypothetical protein
MMGKGMKKNREQGRMGKINDASPKKQGGKREARKEKKEKKGEKKQGGKKKEKRPNPSAVRQTRWRKDWAS